MLPRSPVAIGGGRLNTRFGTRIAAVEAPISIETKSRRFM